MKLLLQKLLFALAIGVLYIYPYSSLHADSERIVLGKEIQDMIRNRSCDRAEQCKTLGFGYSLCGDYKRYDIFSTKNLDEILLRQKAERYYELDRRIYLDRNLDLDCTSKKPTRVVCIRKRCVAAGRKGAFNLLHKAVIDNNSASIIEYVKAGADINEMAGVVETPLHLAAQRMMTSPDTINTLISNGANVNAVSLRGRTPLWYAVKGRRVKVVKLLLERGACPQIHHRTSDNPLRTATKVANAEISLLLNRSLGRSSDELVEGAYGLDKISVADLIVTHIEYKDNGNSWASLQKLGSGAGGVIKVGSEIGSAERSGIVEAISASEVKVKMSETGELVSLESYSQGMKGQVVRRR